MNERLYLQVAPGLEGMLLEELKALGLGGEVTEGAVELSAAPGTYRRLNLELRTPERVFVELGTVSDVREPSAWAKIPLNVPANTKVFARVSGKGDGDVLRFASSAWKVGLTRGFDDESAESGFHVRFHVQGRRCIVRVDTSGELLYRRGYRQEVSRAPLRETLAAGLLALAGYRGEGLLWDPLCGSGTFVLEAARWARHLAPGALRSFAFERFTHHDAKAWAEEKKRSAARALDKAPSIIWGSDNNAGSLGVARRNGKRAEVLEDVTLQRLDATKLPPGPPGPSGLVITNLPYGHRTAERSGLETLYRGFFSSLRTACPAWTVAAYVENVGLLEKTAGMPFPQRYEVANGGLHCTLAVGTVPGPPDAR